MTGSLTSLVQKITIASMLKIIFFERMLEIITILTIVEKLLPSVDILK